MYFILTWTLTKLKTFCDITKIALILIYFGDTNTLFDDCFETFHYDAKTEMYSYTTELPMLYSKFQSYLYRKHCLPIKIYFRLVLPVYKCRQRFLWQEEECNTWKCVSLRLKKDINGLHLSLFGFQIFGKKTQSQPECFNWWALLVNINVHKNKNYHQNSCVI